MKYTLLELTQDVMSSMDSDEINSISDTVESEQVVKIIKTVYDDIISRGDLITNKILFRLNASADANKPVLMTKPDNIDRIDYIQYNKVLNGDTDPVWSDIKYLSVIDFMDYTHGYNPSEASVDTMSHIIADGYTLTFHFKNDQGPQYYTSFDDSTIIFDAYDSSVDTTLQSSKTLCYGFKKTNFVEEDDWTPELQPQQFSLLLNEAKSLAWAELKQAAHPKAEQTARRGWRHLQKTRTQIPDGALGSGTHPFDKLPNYGRR